MMRTTLDVDDDVLAAVEERARLENRSVGEVLSGLSRQALTARAMRSDRSAAGFLTIPKRGHVATHDQVNTIQNSEGI